MENISIKNKGQAELFTSKFLESFTKTHPLLIWTIYLVIIASMVHYSSAVLKLSAGVIAILFISGSFVWTLFEYLIHRFAFHFITANETGKKIIYLFHGNHHEYPRDKQRLFMPPIPSLVISSFFFIVIYLIASLLGVSNYTMSFFSGFVFYYLVYASMHYAIHAFKPPFKWMKSLWINHHMHHYKEEAKGFGVSTTLWDRVFGTMYPVERKRKMNESPMHTEVVFFKNEVIF